MKRGGGRRRCFLKVGDRKVTNRLSARGVTLLELLVGLVLGAILIAGMYRVFTAQSKAYTVQDRVVEVQQSIRSAMELVLRDLRMAGFDDDNIASGISITDPIVYPVKDDAITVTYEDYDRSLSQFQKQTVTYWRDAEASRLIRQLSINDVEKSQETLLENVEELYFEYGVDVDQDGAIDEWVSAEGVKTLKVIAVRVTLAARPEQGNAELQRISPRRLVSVATLRNVSLKR
jgi:type IV pilus assembly protein PilW